MKNKYICMKLGRYYYLQDEIKFFYKKYSAGEIHGVLVKNRNYKSFDWGVPIMSAFNFPRFSLCYSRENGPAVINIETNHWILANQVTGTPKVFAWAPRS